MVFEEVESACDERIGVTKVISRATAFVRHEEEVREVVRCWRQERVVVANLEHYRMVVGYELESWLEVACCGFGGAVHLV